MKYEATRLRDSWCVRPEGACGTIGWHPEPWEAIFVSARDANEALRKAKRIRASVQRTTEQVKQREP